MIANITITNDITIANAITHGGIFHADEVFGTIILSKVMDNIVLARTFKVPEDIADDVIVYDIGGGDFDHHQLGGNGTRADGIPYASCGLLWKEYGPQLCATTANPERAFAMMDAKLISGIDANDTGYISPKDCPPGMSVSAVISGFNPRWDEKTSADEKFLMALQMAETIFDNTFASICSTIAAEAAVEEAIETSPEEDVVVFSQFVPWQGTLLSSHNPKAEKMLYVVFPSLRGGWNWQGVPVSCLNRDLRKPCPEEWKGQPADELRRMTGIGTVNFVHPAGFLGSCGTREDAIKMAKLAIAE